MKYLSGISTRSKGQREEGVGGARSSCAQVVAGDDDHLGQKAAANAFLGGAALGERAAKETRLPAPGLKPILKRNNLFRETERPSDVSQSCSSCNNN